MNVQLVTPYRITHFQCYGATVVVTLQCVPTLIGTLEVERFLDEEGVTTLLAFCKEETTNAYLYVVCVDVPPLQ